MASNKWQQLFDATSNTIITAPVPPTLQSFNNKLYNEAMHTFDTKTRASLHDSSDFLSNGIKLLWAHWGRENVI
eukprot:1852921-Ditylum_brightwellii.AAC.1